MMCFLVFRQQGVLWHTEIILVIMIYSFLGFHPFMGFDDNKKNVEYHQTYPLA